MLKPLSFSYVQSRCKYIYRCIQLSCSLTSKQMNLLFIAIKAFTKPLYKKIYYALKYIRIPLKWRRNNTLITYFHAAVKFLFSDDVPTSFLTLWTWLMKVWTILQVEHFSRQDRECKSGFINGIFWTYRKNNKLSYHKITW